MDASRRASAEKYGNVRDYHSHNLRHHRRIKRSARRLARRVLRRQAQMEE